MAEEPKNNPQPKDDFTQFGEHIPSMIKVSSVDKTKGQPVAPMTPVPQNPAPSDNSSTSNQSGGQSSDNSSNNQQKE